MLALIFAAAFFVGAPLDAELGANKATELFARGCEALDGKYDANARVNTVGRNKEYADAPSHVPYCHIEEVPSVFREVF